MRYNDLDFGTANASGSPTVTTFRRTDTRADVQPHPTVSVDADGLGYFDFDWSVTEASEIVYKFLLNGVEVAGVINRYGTTAPASLPTGSVDIANMALDHLGVTKKIVTMDENTEAAKAARRWYDVVRRLLIEYMPWDFATRRSNIVADSAEASVHPSYMYAYTLPAGYLKGWGFLPFGFRNWAREYEISWKCQRVDDGSASKIYTDFFMSSQDRFVYSIDVTDTAEFPNHFVEALSYALALKMAAPLRIQTEVVKEVAAGWFRSWNDALAREKSDGAPDVQDASWIQARL